MCHRPRVAVRLQSARLWYQHMPSLLQFKFMIHCHNLKRCFFLVCHPPRRMTSHHLHRCCRRHKHPTQLVHPQAPFRRYVWESNADRCTIRAFEGGQAHHGILVYYTDRKHIIRIILLSYVWMPTLLIRACMNRHLRDIKIGHLRSAGLIRALKYSACDRLFRNGHANLGCWIAEF